MQRLLRESADSFFVGIDYHQCYADLPKESMIEECSEILENINEEPIVKPTLGPDRT